jgi:bifunctional DNA-binding transcriptional regulator/antitoxin component of YhaV-PrlF toxin-antitoxin module
MGFQVVSQTYRPFTNIHNVRFAVVLTPTTRVGKVTLPPTVVQALGWEPKSRLEVLAGQGDDAGWFAITPAGPEANYRAKFKIASNGVGRFNTSALVPAAITGPVNTREPETRLEGNTFYIKVL